MYEPDAPHSLFQNELRALAPMLTEGSLLQTIALQLLAEIEQAASGQVIVRVEHVLAA
ncbi:hypothetical protein [Cupriavidus pinatubonensis]|uniref:Uncharacterized protein n=1 Tax=Cupriavidus pinatubonensis TaxID=248026 RepID=A0ABM8XGN3_9BURK|nr:hypothetical protein [Cupriavidus pinatubonensis]CAG9179316.1 hypothetical protein LMG23994_04126 [Cupriavidus pinatubonensis]